MEYDYKNLITRLTTGSDAFPGTAEYNNAAAKK